MCMEKPKGCYLCTFFKNVLIFSFGVMVGIFLTIFALAA